MYGFFIVFKMHMPHSPIHIHTHTLMVEAANARMLKQCNRTSSYHKAANYISMLSFTHAFPH